ncbi:MAG: methyltransferase domain-containing protein, partial [Thermoanaerobaculia bacterium]|nr:methyltransferase domain-containing protein [Thermoanaerobaculia bacterium]
MTATNEQIVEAWNTVLFDKWIRFKHLVTVGLEPHGFAAMSRCEPKPGERFLDLGCGFGDTTFELARRVGPDGEAVGVDCAANF